MFTHISLPMFAHPKCKLYTALNNNYRVAFLFGFISSPGRLLILLSLYIEELSPNKFRIRLKLHENGDRKSYQQELNYIDKISKKTYLETSFPVFLKRIATLFVADVKWI